MGSRYIVTGAQLGTILALVNVNPVEATSLINKIIEEQCIGTSTRELKQDLVKLYDVLK